MVPNGTLLAAHDNDGVVVIMVICARCTMRFTLYDWESPYIDIHRWYQCTPLLHCIASAMALPLVVAGSHWRWPLLVGNRSIVSQLMLSAANVYQTVYK